MSIHFLNDDDVQAIKELVAERKRRRANPQQRPYYPDDDAKAPDVYVALTGSGGIPGMEDHGSSGTGTGFEPGAAACAIYRVVHNSTNSPRLKPLGFNIVVHNLSFTAVLSNTWMLVERDKLGKWWTVNGAGGGGVDSDGCIWGQLIEEGLGANGYEGHYGWREMVEDGSGGFSVKPAGLTGTILLGAARCSSLKEAVPLGIVVKLCRGADTLGTGTYDTPFWWFTTPDLDQDILCLSSTAAGETGTGENSCLYNGTSYALPDEWAESVVTKYNPLVDTWFRKGECWLKHINNMSLVAGLRYRGHMCGFNICGDPVYTTSDCCAEADPGSNDGDDIPEKPGTGTGTATERDRITTTTTTFSVTTCCEEIGLCTPASSLLHYASSTSGACSINDADGNPLGFNATNGHLSINTDPFPVVAEPGFQCVFDNSINATYGTGPDGAWPQLYIELHYRDNATPCWFMRCHMFGDLDTHPPEPAVIFDMTLDSFTSCVLAEFSGVIPAPHNCAGQTLRVTVTN